MQWRLQQIPTTNNTLSFILLSLSLPHHRMAITAADQLHKAIGHTPFFVFEISVVKIDFGQLGSLSLATWRDREAKRGCRHNPQQW